MEKPDDSRALLKRMKFNVEQTDAERFAAIADCTGLSVAKLGQLVIEHWMDGKLYPLPPKWRAMEKERQALQRKAIRQHEANISRVERQSFAADRVFYRRPLGRPGLVPPPDQKMMDFTWQHGRHHIEQPLTGVELWDFVRMFCWDRTPEKARKGPRPSPLPAEDARGLLAARAWRAVGGIELFRREPHGMEFTTLWLPGDAPPVDVLIDPEDDPWTHRITPVWHSQPSLQL